MKTAKLSAWALVPAGVSVAALLLSPALSQRAHAFGGFWSSESGAVRQAAAAVIFVDNPGPTVTAIVRIEYEGPAQRFAWLVPVPGEPTIGISSNAVFERLEAATAPEYWVEVATEGTCLEPRDPQAASDAGADSDGAPGTPDPTTTPVAVIDAGSIGPYDYVNIAVDSALDDPAEVATEWLTANGYDLTGLESEVLSPYLADGLNLLAFRLSGGTDEGAIRPVALTYESELPAIPITPAALAAQEDMGILLWVIGPSQAVPDNYASLVINDARIDWLTGEKYMAGTLPAGGSGPFGPIVSKPSNYDAVVTAAADEAGGHGFVTELAAPASQFRDKVWSTVDDENFATISGQTYADGIDAIVMAHGYYGGWDGFSDAVEGATTLPAGVTFDEFRRDPDQYRGVAEVDVALFFRLLDAGALRPVAEAAAMLHRAPYLTRLFTTMSPEDMTVDPAFDYNFDLAQVSNVHVARQLVECSPTLEQDEAPWRMELPQGGVVVGEGSSAWPVPAGSMPANLKIVMLGTSGSGTVVRDNSEEIGMTLWQSAGTTGRGAPPVRSPQNGLLIGGSQTLTPPPAGDASTDGGTSGPEPADGDTCSVSYVGAGAGSSLASWIPLAALLLALRARRLRRSSHAARSWAGIGLLLAACSSACSSDDAAPAPAHDDAGAAPLPGSLTREQLRDPETCKGCHPTHYREWSSSMHAYAAKDPVFLAMNKRGQRETDGELGDFCVQCHAPMAVVDGLTTDGLDLPQLSDMERGVSCYFCHNVIGIDGDHNAALRLADDTTMRGPIDDPLEPSAHRAEFSEIFDDSNPESSAMCGACHDIVTPSGVRLERTFQEYRHGIFSKSATGDGPAFDSCVGCHMPPRQGFAAVVPEGAPERNVHEHLWPGVDVALTDFPHRDALRSAVESCELAKSVPFFTLEVTPPDLFSFQIETGAGHHQPSGAAQDRRMWLEFLAYDASGRLLDEVSSGDIADGEVEERPQGDPEHDPRLLLFRDRIYDAQGKPVHMFWEAAKSRAYPEGYASSVLPVATTTYIEGKNAVLKQYRARAPDGGLPARVTARLRMRPIGMDVLQDLVDSGDLDPEIAAEMPTFTFGAQIDWTPEDGMMQTIRAELTSDCSTYRCLLDPSSQDCQ